MTNYYNIFIMPYTINNDLCLNSFPVSYILQQVVSNSLDGSANFHFTGYFIENPYFPFEYSLYFVSAFAARSTAKSCCNNEGARDVLN